MRHAVYALGLIPAILGATIPGIAPRQADGQDVVTVTVTHIATSRAGYVGSSRSSPAAASSSRLAVSSAVSSFSRPAVTTRTSTSRVIGSGATAMTRSPSPTPSSPENPCGFRDDMLEQYDYVDAQIALRYGPAPADQGANSSSSRPSQTAGGTVSATLLSSSAATPTRRSKLAHTLQCLHAGGPVRDPSAPSIGLYGGSKVQLVPCQDAYYRWSIRGDGKGIVAGNGCDSLWALNAEEVQGGANLTIRELDQSGNQTFSLTESGQLRVDGDETENGLCVQASNGTVSLAPCSQDEKDEEQYTPPNPSP